MGQTNVFPTAETVDPITGMPVSAPDSGSKTSGKRLAAVVLATLLIGVLILGLLWFFLFRPSSDGASGSTGPVEVTATFTGTIDPACVDLGAALTADDLSTTVASRLNDVAIAKDLEENKAYFEQLARDIAPLMEQYQSACVAAVSAGNAPEFYRTFVDTFEASVTDGATVATTALDSGGQVSQEEADRLRAEASKLEASAAAVISTLGVTDESTASPEASASPEVSGSATAPETDSVVPSPIG
jgi:multidrug resistance efflux pump